MGRDIAWIDIGTHVSLLEAVTFICRLEAMPKSPYKDYLLQRFKAGA